jgi:hypothetical protein
MAAKKTAFPLHAGEAVDPVVNAILKAASLIASNCAVAAGGKTVLSQEAISVVTEFDRLAAAMAVSKSR